MKRSWLVAAVFFSLLFGSWPAQAQNPNDFTISLFAADFFLSKDERGAGVMEVNELIVAEFPQTDQNHGIERALPQTYEGQDLNIQIDAVLNEHNQPHQYTTYESDGQLVLRIGNPSTFAHGTTFYKINYRLENVITFYDENDELFWDVNGTGWSQPITQVIAQVHLPNDLASVLRPEQRCFTGPLGSTAQNCTIETRDTSESKAIIFSAANLQPQENLTLVMGFEPGTFYQNPWSDIWRSLSIALAGLLPVLTLGLMWRRWHRYGRDAPGKGTVIARYTPPEKLNALTSDVLLYEKFRTESLGSALIELATLGYIKIYESQKKKLLKDQSSYELELTGKADLLGHEQQTLVKALFGDEPQTGQRIKLSSKSHKLWPAAQKLASELPAKLAKNGYFKADPRRIRHRYTALAVVAGVAGLILGILSASWWLALAGILSGLIIGLFGRVMPARSRKGAQTRDHLLGLKEYMQLAEAERIKYLQSPAGIRQYGQPTETGTQLKLFETLLPYAMLFGLEGEWAKQFEHLYSQPPQWLDSYRSFNAASFASSINGLGTSTANAFAPPAGSGGSAGSSGFGGGGSSGGGGGGGGGGGW